MIVSVGRKFDSRVDNVGTVSVTNVNYQYWLLSFRQFSKVAYQSQTNVKSIVSVGRESVFLPGMLSVRTYMAN